MLCFRDKSFCSAYDKTCINTLCDRALTAKLRKEAHAWWGDNTAPIAFMDFSEGCELQVRPIKPEPEAAA